MLTKILCFWGILSIVFLGWDYLPGHLFGVFLGSFFKEYLILTIAIFSFSLAYLVYQDEVSSN